MEIFDEEYQKKMSEDWINDSANEGFRNYFKKYNNGELEKIKESFKDDSMTNEESTKFQVMGD